MARLKETYEPQGFKVFPISAATNKGLDELLTEVGRILREYPEDIVFEEEYEEYDEVKVDQEPLPSRRSRMAISWLQVSA